MPDVPPEFTKPQARKSGGGTAHASVPSMAELLSPLDEASFFSDYWERAPLHVRRADPDFNGAVFGFGDVSVNPCRVLEMCRVLGIITNGIIPLKEVPMEADYCLATTTV